MRLGLLALLISVLPSGLGATVLLPADFPEIVNGADLIVYGRVTATEARESADRRQVDTLVTLEAGTYLKGGGSGTVVLKVPGGAAGRYMNITVGAPTFRVGDEAVFFLKTRPGDYATVFGLNQGVFRVALDRTTRRRLVSAPVASRTGRAETVRRGDAARRPLPLEAFGDQVQAVLAERPQAPR